MRQKKYSNNNNIVCGLVYASSYAFKIDCCWIFFYSIRYKSFFLISSYGQTNTLWLHYSNWFIPIRNSKHLRYNIEDVSLTLQFLFLSLFLLPSISDTFHIHHYLLQRYFHIEKEISRTKRVRHRLLYT